MRIGPGGIPGGGTFIRGGKGRGGIEGKEDRDVVKRASSS